MKKWTFEGKGNMKENNNKKKMFILCEKNILKIYSLQLQTREKSV